MTSARSPHRPRPLDEPRRPVWIFDAVIGVAVGLIAAATIVAARAGTAMATLRSRHDGTFLPPGFAGLLGIALALALLLAVAVAAGIVVRHRRRRPGRA